MNIDFWNMPVQPTVTKKKNSRAKGQRGEYEIRDLLREHFPDKTIERNLDQVRNGGVDFICFSPFQIEVKYRETLQVNTWWNELVRKCRWYEIPVLIYRKNRSPWTVVTFVDGLVFGEVTVRDSIGVRVTMGLDCFLRILKSYE